MGKRDVLNVCYLNVYHLYNKVLDVNHMLNSFQNTIHILGLSETRLDETKDDKNISITNYSIIRRDKQFDKHTGIAAYIHDSIKHNIKRRHDLEYKEIEALWLEIKHEKSVPFLICLIYRNPRTKIADWQRDFETMLNKIPYNKYELQILGDFNINLKEPQVEWNAIISQFGLKQLITEHTREKGTSQTIIDHIYTNHVENVNESKVIKTGISDHFAIFYSYNFKIAKQNTKGHTCINYRCYKRFDEKSYLADLSLLPFNEIYNITEPNTALKYLCTLIMTVIDKHAPLKTKRVKHPDIPAWLTQETMKAMELRNKFKKDKKEDEFKIQRNIANKLVERDKQNYFNSLIKDDKNTATIWKAINGITNSSRKKSNSNKIELEPDTINDFFLNLPETILTQQMRYENLNYECPPRLVSFCETKNISQHFHIPYLTVLEVGKLISNMKNSKSLGPENMPVYLLKTSLPFIVEQLTYIYNLCIDKCVFPSLLKEAKVIPLPKSKDTSHPQNLRPISLLPILSKPLEKHIHKHMYEHLDKHKLIHEYQSGFRPKHSCQTALTNLIDNWLKCINDKKLIGTVFLDFKKAFDLVHHTTLLKKVAIYFPNSKIIDLMKSYLTERSQYVHLNGRKSSTKNITSGVPQGSVLGPLFFLVYINDLPLHITSETQNDLFADDASIHTNNEDIKTIETNLQNNITEAKKWCDKNSMIIHPEKTKCMVITTRQQKQRTNPTLELNLDTTKIEQVKCHRMLGVLIDSELNWNFHIDSIIKRISKNIFLLTKLKKLTSTDNLKLFFNAQIMPHFNYASTLFDNCSKDAFKPLNSIHRRAVKHLINQPGQQTDEKLKILKILPLEKQFEFNKTLLVHRIYHERTPSYLKNLIEKPPERYHSKNLILPLPRIDLYKGSLSYSGTYIWNKLPQELKNITSENSFKNKLKNLLLMNNV